MFKIPLTQARELRLRPRQQFPQQLQNCHVIQISATIQKENVMTIDKFVGASKAITAQTVKKQVSIFHIYLVIYWEYF